MRKFKILLVLVLAICMFTAYTPFATAVGNERVVGYFPGDIVAIDDGGILIDHGYGEILLNISDDTIFMDSSTREAVDFSVLKVGDKISAFCSMAMTRSIPPQSNCFAILTNIKDDEAKGLLLGVDKITADDDGSIKFLDTEGEFIITVPADAPVCALGSDEALTLDDIKEGDYVFVWFLMVATSYPGQAQTDMVIITDIKPSAPGEPTPPPTDNLVARPTASTVLVNGESVAFDAYHIGGNNYFKLRDLAFTLSGTEKQFEVEFIRETNTIMLIGEEPYTVVGGEMTGKGQGEKTPVPTKSNIIFVENMASDAPEAVELTAYNIENNNYFKLRDIGELFDFGVEWDAATSTIMIDTSKGYTPE
jgi:hypothetical protein